MSYTVTTERRRCPPCGSTFTLVVQERQDTKFVDCPRCARRYWSRGDQWVDHPTDAPTFTLQEA